jgi:antitoxin component of RelBE/YafQ-DinJ toxin-antitoxin module
MTEARKHTTISAAVPAGFDKMFDETVGRLGLTPSAALRLLAGYVVFHGKLPFEISEETRLSSIRRGHMNGLELVFEKN